MVVPAGAWQVKNASFPAAGGAPHEQVVHAASGGNQSLVAEPWSPGSVAAGDLLPACGRHPRGELSRRTAASNRTGPSLRTRARSLQPRSSATLTAAHQVAGRKSLPAASSTAGQAHSSRSRTWFTYPVVSPVSCRRRAPRCRSRAPDRVRALGLITVQGRRQAGDDHRVLRVGLIERQALALAGLVDQQRLHAHQRQATVRGQLVQHPPPVPRRLARQRHRRETRRNGPADRPASSSPSSHAQAVTCRLAIPSESWSVTTAACLLPARSIPTIA